MRLAQRLELPVCGFELRGRDVSVLTQPRGEGPEERPAAEADPAARWFRDNAGDQPESVLPRNAKMPGVYAALNPGRAVVVVLPRPSTRDDFTR